MQVVVIDSNSDSEDDPEGLFGKELDEILAGSATTKVVPDEAEHAILEMEAMGNGSTVNGQISGIER